ncbi:ATP-dependent DNA helicase RecG [Caproiciproducens sp. NJN-50]|uniref:ATP-dependent DNA helicase RecG n=1 Tax=Caproiciproducens sp. NJN-50 TaxID=2507162 RepID=UPI000FFE0309|nr:ATP-dependent DNA helicase RecG [Caproiciproducens sp. NJN-50]QAT49227.1 ATP-dependent DNA helicase RecG [Caproiciproducens sp. NJN-50]
MASLFKQDIQTLKGVGRRRAELFRKLGAPSVGALLRLYPRAYEDLSRPFPVRTAPLGTVCAVRAAVEKAPTETRIRGGMTLYKTRAFDGESTLELTFFNNRYVMNLLHPGEEYLFYGKVTANFLKREMISPEFYPAASCPPVLPVYRQTSGLSSRLIGNAVREALRLLPDPMADPLPPMLRKEQTLSSLDFALKNIHFPDDMESLKSARERLIFEEFLVLQLGLLRIGGRTRARSRFQLQSDRTGEFYRLLPFQPTEAQKRAVRESMADMLGGFPMNRLIQGDVGSGKTAVAAALCHSAIKNGMQAALMAPTEILARQHARTLSALLSPTGIRIGLLTGSLPAAEKRKLRGALADGEIDLLVGTHALISDGVSFKRLGLVVTDEQHRFGVAQRAALAAKGDRPHTLVMSATPIPRTLALMIYGDLDLSILDELPPGRKETKTYAVTPDVRPRVFAFVRRYVRESRQCYIICPMIDESGSDMESVNSYAQRLKSKWLPDCRIGTLHGKMKPKEKEAVMNRFSAGEIDVLVSTTVVEVGVDVPNATVMLIENAERYGLSQLHQLRGRIGRGTCASTCILISAARNEEALARLKILCSTSDGFQIADEDLKLRGPGDFFGDRQHGLPDLKIADMTTNMESLRKAQETAQKIFRADPELSLPEHRGLRAEVRQLFQNWTD